MTREPDYDALILRHLFVHRYGRSLGNRLLKLIKSDDDKLIALLRDFEADATEAELAALMRRNERSPSVKNLLAELLGIIANQQTLITELMQAEMLQLAEQEINKTYQYLGSIASTKPSADAALKRPILGGVGLAEAWATLFSSHTIRVLTLGITNALQDQLQPSIIIKGTRDQGYKDGLLSKRDQQVLALAETQASGVAGNARDAAYGRLKVQREVLVATLDFRTTPFCRSVDGDVFAYGEGLRPPFHYRCRTIRLPYLGEMMERPSVKDSRPVSKIPKDEREGKVATTRFTYQQWFERLSEGQKREILGKGRYELWQQGRIGELGDLVNDRTGKNYTLDELERIY